MNPSRIETYFSGKEEELIQAVSRLVRIPSVKGEKAPGMPFGEEVNWALQEALALSAQMNLPGESLEGYVGIVDLNRGETVLHILAHLDVVDGGSGWTVTTPFEPALKAGLLYGRGTDDDKGPLVAALFAMKAVKDLKIPLTKNVRLIMGTDEESGFDDIHWYYAGHPYAPCTFSPDAGFPLINIEKGHYQTFFDQRWESETALPRVTSFTGGPRINVIPSHARAVVTGLSPEKIQPFCDGTETNLGVSFTLEAKDMGTQILCNGRGGHASRPEEASNAQTALLALLSSLPLADCASSRAIHSLNTLFPHGEHFGSSLGIAQSDELSGALTLSFTMLSLGNTGLEGRFDSRTPICATEANCRLPAEAKLAGHGLTLRGDLVPAHHTPADSPFVQTLLRCYKQFTGDKGECLSTGGGTYVHGIPGGVAFGASMPGFDSGLHGPDEKTRVADLLTACKIFTQAIIDLCT